MFRLAFNSNQVDTKFTFDLKELDPDTIVTDPAFKDLRVTFFLEELEDLSNSSELTKQVEGYKTIEASLQYHTEKVKPTIESQLNIVNVFGDPDFDDRDEMMIVNKDQEEHSEMSGEEV